MADINKEEMGKIMFDALQYFAHSGDPTYLLLPQRSLLGIPNAAGDSCLHVAINGEQTQAACIIAAVLSKDELNAYNKDMETPLHVATRLCQVDTVDGLIRLGADIAIANAMGDTCVHIACRASDSRLVSSMVAAADNEHILSQANHEGLSPIHMAASNGNVKVLMAVAERCNGSLNVKDAVSGRTALHVAVRNGFLEHASTLISRGADLNARDQQGNTPLHIVAATGRADIAALLLHNNADVTIANDYRQTALDVARSHRSSVFEDAMKLDACAAKGDQSMAALEAGFEFLSMDDVATLPSSDWELGGIGKASRHARSRLNKMLKGHRRSMRVPFLASKSRKCDSSPTSASADSMAGANVVYDTGSTFTRAGEEKRALQQKYAPRMELKVETTGAGGAQEKEALTREYIVTNYVVGDTANGTGHGGGGTQAAKALEAAQTSFLACRSLDNRSLAMID